MPSAVHGWAVETAVQNTDSGRRVVMSVEDDRITVLFDDYGHRTLLLESIEHSGVLVAR